MYADQMFFVRFEMKMEKLNFRFIFSQFNYIYTVYIVLSFLKIVWIKFLRTWQCNMSVLQCAVELQKCSKLTCDHSVKDKIFKTIFIHLMINVKHTVLNFNAAVG